VHLPPTWAVQTGPDLSRGHLGTYMYADDFNSIQVSLFVERNSKRLKLEQLTSTISFQFEKALVDKTTHVVSDATITTAAIIAKAISLPLPPNGVDAVNRLLVAFAPLPNAPNNEVLYCHFKYKSIEGKPLQQLEDMGRAVMRMIEINPKNSKENDGLVTYLNLTWGFGFKYDSSKYRPMPAGSTVRLIPRHTLPQLASSGEPAGVFSPIFKDINPGLEDDITVEQFAQKTREMIQTQSPGRYELDDRNARLGGVPASKNIVVMGNEKIMTYFARTPDNKWFIVRWHTFEADFEMNRKTIETTFDTFFFFSPDI